jgi:hypothetical protein
MRAKLILLSVTMLAASHIPAQSSPGKQPANSAFQRVWERTDSLVLSGKVQRTWLWGPEPLATLKEPLTESPDGMREVQYYDKSRMEINNPSANPASPWYVTNGLLVYEMVSGKVQVGTNNYEARAPARISVAGDTVTDTSKLPQSSLKPPSYETLRHVATLAPGQNQRAPRPGVEVTQVLEHAGQVRELKEEEKLSLRRTELPRLAHHVTDTGHNIPDVFWNFMNRTGSVYEDGKEREGKLVDWVYAMGYPITEPYWAWIRTGDGATLVLIQAFQRRVLTYNPENTQDWQVEMGNVGSHYYMWRYGNLPGAPSGANAIPMREVMRDTVETPRPRYDLFTNEAAWTSYWNSYRQNPSFPPMPIINFQDEIALAAAWGPRSNTGYRIAIQSITLKDKTLTVKVRQWHTGGAVGFMVIHPAHVVAIPRNAFDGGTYTVIFLDTEDVMLNRTELSLP